jgi:hypothetical protein
MKNYKLYLVFLFAICLCLCSCKLMRLTGDENFVSKSDQMKLEMDLSLTVKVKIDGKDERFLFDTGASNTVVFDTTLINNFSKKERISFLDTKDPNGKISSFFVPSTIDTEMYTFNNQLVSVLSGMKNYCTDTYVWKGVIGSSFFKKSESKIYLFDFDSLTLYNSKTQPDEVGFHEVKATFFNRHFAVYLNINGNEEPFLFDTGNNAYPLIIGSDSKIKPINYTEFLGSEGVVGSGNLKSNSKYSNENQVFLAELKINVPICFLSKNIGKYNNMGLDFIKHFNWIIDYESKKVFFKRNNIPILNQDIIPKYNYLSMITNNQLKIISKLKSESRLNINDQIISVNSQKVTPENICEMQELLNSTNDWNALQIEILKN